MFKNRSIKVSLVKDKKTVNPAVEQEPQPSFEDLVNTTRDGLKDVVIATIAGMAVFIVLDTARQVIVNRTNPSNQ
jgi:hypothetical protein